MFRKIAGSAVFLLGVSLFDRGSGFLTQTGFANSERYHDMGIHLITVSILFFGLAAILWSHSDES